jgi:hypothetical protein
VLETIADDDARTTTSWDVRTKRVTYESVPTKEGAIGIANYGPHAVLFTVGRSHTVQQYDLNPEGIPAMINEVQHVPAVVPPSPPFSDGEHGNIMTTAGSSSRHQKQQDLTSSEDDSNDYKSPLHQIVLDIGNTPGELGEGRDILAPLSPVSSRSSNRSSNVGNSKRKLPTYPTRFERTQAAKLRPKSPGTRSTMSSTPSTVFSSGSSNTSSRRVTSRLRQEILVSPEEARYQRTTDLFPFIKARLTEVQFKPPRYPEGARTPDYLRQEMMRCIFGWDGDIDELIRWELSHHDPNSAAAVLLAKWLGDLGSNMAASMIGTESMTDWMLLALSAVGGDSQRKVGDVFVQRLLEKGDIHPAAALLLGLGENNEAIEVYVSRGYFLEAVLLVCLLTPNDWQRISHLARQWGEIAISEKQSELAVRCFACTGVESSEPWFSPAAKDAVYQAQMRIIGPDGSPGSSSNPNITPTDSLSAGSSRKPAQAGLKLITDFSGMSTKPGNVGDDKTPIFGMTPMDTSLSPSTALQGRWTREPMSSVTATPGGLTSRRLPSRDRSRDQLHSRTPVSTARYRPEDHLHAPNTTTKTPKGLPSPAQNAFSSSKTAERLRNGSRDRKPENLHVDIADVFIDPSLSSAMTTSTERTHTSGPALVRLGAPSPVMADGNSRQKIRGIDEYVSSLGEASYRQEQKRGDSRNREQRNLSRGRATSENGGKRYIRPAKRSPSSPVSMSPEDPALKMAFASVKAAALAEAKKDESSDAENFYRVASPILQNPGIDSVASPMSNKGRTPSFSQARPPSKTGRRSESNERSGQGASRSRPPTGRAESRAKSPEREPGRRGRSRPADPAPARRSPESPVSMNVAASDEPVRKPRDKSIGARVRARGSSSNRTANRGDSPDAARQRERSSSARRKETETRAESPPRLHSRTTSRSRRPSVPKLQTNFSDPHVDSRKTLAAKELEARRRSLARRPSAPVILHPDALASPVSAGGSRQQDVIPTEQDLIQGHSGSSDTMMHVNNNITGTSTSSVPIGLPSNPKAMRHTKYMTAEPDEYDITPAVPQIPGNLNRSPTAEPMLLPASIFVPPNRSSSAPIEKMLGPNAPLHMSRESLSTRPIHSRMSSLNEMITGPNHPPPPPPPPPGPIIDRNSGLAVLDSSVVIVQDRDSVDMETVILPELQHLAHASALHASASPPSNSSSNSLGVINIGISTPEPMTLTNTPLQLVSVPVQSSSAEVLSTPSHRRGRGSIGGSISEASPPTSHSGLGGKLRGVRDRLRDRSGSRTRNKSPPRFTHSPYESVSGQTEQRSKSVQPIMQSTSGQPGGSTTNLTLPSVAYGGPGPTLSQATYNPNAPVNTALPSTTAGYRTPKEIARAVMQQSAANAPPVPPVPIEQLQFGINAERHAPQVGLPSNMTGYRNPKEIRANMPPNSIQPGTGPMQTLNGEPF